MLKGAQPSIMKFSWQFTQWWDAGLGGGFPPLLPPLSFLSFFLSQPKYLMAFVPSSGLGHGDTFFQSEIVFL